MSWVNPNVLIGSRGSPSLHSRQLIFLGLSTSQTLGDKHRCIGGGLPLKKYEKLIKWENPPNSCDNNKCIKPPPITVVANCFLPWPSLARPTPAENLRNSFFLPRLTWNSQQTPGWKLPSTLASERMRVALWRRYVQSKRQKASKIKSFVKICSSKPFVYWEYFEATIL